MGRCVGKLVVTLVFALAWNGLVAPEVWAGSTDLVESAERSGLGELLTEVIQRGFPRVPGGTAGGHTRGQLPESALAADLDAMHRMTRSGRLGHTSLEALMRLVRWRLDHPALAETERTNPQIIELIHAFRSAVGEKDARVGVKPVFAEGSGNRLTGVELWARPARARSTDEPLGLRLELRPSGTTTMYFRELGAGGRLGNSWSVDLPERERQPPALRGQLVRLVGGDEVPTQALMDAHGGRGRVWGTSFAAAEPLRDIAVRSVVEQLIALMPSASGVREAARATPSGWGERRDGTVRTNEGPLFRMEQALDRVYRQGRVPWIERVVHHQTGEVVGVVVGAYTETPVRGRDERRVTLTVGHDRGGVSVSPDWGGTFKVVTPPQPRTLVHRGAKPWRDTRRQPPLAQRARFVR